MTRISSLPWITRWARWSVQLGLGLGLAAMLQTACAASGDDLIQTDQGTVQGVVRRGALEFRGIPFAAPPVGELRWAKPQAAQPWSGVFDASSFGHACAQTRRYALTEASSHEDCLSLNVSRPADLAPGEKLPVLFWIHGGAFVGGSTNLYRLDKLAVQGRMVVVSANYRVGFFGFLAIEGIDADHNGDVGLEDQRAAMRWVQRNIAAFGGDPDNVTVAGESAGAGSVCLHLGSPGRVAGLFHKAIVLSGGCLHEMPTLQAALDDRDAAKPPMWKQLAAKVGCNTEADGLACLRRAPVEAVLAAQDTLATGLMGVSPLAGTGSVPQQVAEGAKTGALMRVPVLMGGAQDELRLYVAYFKLFAPFVSDYSEAKLRSFWLPNFYGQNAPDPADPSRSKHDAIIARYRVADGLDGAQMGSMLSDHQRAVGISHCAYLNAADTLMRWMPVIYQMEFADPNAPVLGVGIAPGMDPGFALGAVHSSELNAFFPNLSNTSANDAPDLAPASQQLADQMLAYWAAFVRTGWPSPTGLPAWPPYSGHGATVMRFEPGKTGMYDAHAYHRCEFWNALYP